MPPQARSPGSPLDSLSPAAFAKAGVAGDISQAALRAAVPAHCFVRSPLRSLFFVVRDAALMALVVYAQLRFGLPLAAAGWLPAFCVWVAYAVVCGTVATGLWVIAHECGHDAFSSYSWLNDLVGLTLHSFLLVPFFPWSVSHAKHHKFTNHLLLGETHVPPLMSDRKDNVVLALLFSLAEAVDVESFAVINVVNHLLFGWPAYILFNITGSRLNWRGERLDRIPNYGNTVLAGKMSHLRASGSEMYEPKHHFQIRISAIAISAMAVLLFAAAYSHGALAVLKWYGGPYLVVNGWLVLYTWLQHTHVDIPHYGGAYALRLTSFLHLLIYNTLVLGTVPRKPSNSITITPYVSLTFTNVYLIIICMRDDAGDASFSWLRGALSTVDRPYPWLVDELHHHIGTTHVLHHLFSHLPHYHAQEASVAIQSVLGDAYRFDPTPIYQAACECARDCIFVERLEGVQKLIGIEEYAAKEEEAAREVRAAAANVHL